MKGILVILFIPFLSFSQKVVEFQFMFHAKDLEEGEWFVSNSGDSVQFTNIQFFVSVPPEPKGKITANSVHLVDWTKPETHLWTVPNAKNNSLQFILGLDSIYNVSSNMEGDLNPSLGMYWAWQSGYIQMKIEGKSPSSNERKNRFQYHLGGYLQPFSVASVLNFGELVEEKVIIEVHLDRFFEGLEIAKTPNVMIPGAEAMERMDSARKIFSVQP